MDDIEQELIESLQDIGYDGALLDAQKLSQALEKGPKSTEFTSLVSWLAEQLILFGSTEEHVHPTTCPEDSSTFLLELSSFLKELGCLNSQLVSGNVNQRLATKHERYLLLDYLITELMACKITKVKKPDTAKLQLTIHESDTARCLREILTALQLGKPPENITAEQLFKKLQEKLKTIVSSAPADLLGKPLIFGELSKSQWDKLDQLQNDMREEYKIRREMLLKRLDVTVQSFLWSERIKLKEDQLNECFRKNRDQMIAEPAVTIAQLLAARDDVAIIEKTSSASVRKNTKSNVTKVIIGDVPDRGGRAHEQAPPPPEMPSWQKDRVPDAPRGGGRGGRGGGGRGGGGGGYHKDINTNFGQNRDWQDNSQGGSYYQDDNRGDYHRGGRGGGNSGGYHRGRGGRVQGGWAQGGSGYNRGGHRSHY
ncbi:protein FAM98A [Chelonus insularis]|uniref:protein FAM98A n=1 Tax=Chelonus insularis TaxID=460826 RepID=UPI00158CA2B5|nr:protein FAM98A [Chelonus insularis]